MLHGNFYAIAYSRDKCKNLKSGAQGRNLWSHDRHRTRCELASQSAQKLRGQTAGEPWTDDGYSACLSSQNWCGFASL